MNLYLDTSCLIKLYLEESGSQIIREKARNVPLTASSWITYAETHSAFARRLGEGSITAPAYREYLALFAGDWDKIFRINCDERVGRMAGEVSGRHRLRGMDAIHLASALCMRERNPSEPLEFLSADARLNLAAGKEGLRATFSV